MPVRPCRAFVPVFAVAAAVTVVASALADVPDPRFCSADARIVASPDGATPYRVTLRDAANQPLAGMVAILDFTASPGVSLCASADPDHDGRLTAISGANGVAQFAVRAGGSTTSPVRVGTAMFDVTTTTFTSLDLDADFDVDAADRAALVALFGTSGPTGDFNGDATVDANDQALLDAGFGGVCGGEAPPPPPPPPPADPQFSWGGVKAIYR